VKLWIVLEVIRGIIAVNLGMDEWQDMPSNDSKAAHN
jgi:hypothetical protein